MVRSYLPDNSLLFCPIVQTLGAFPNFINSSLSKGGLFYIHLRALITINACRNKKWIPKKPSGQPKCHKALAIHPYQSLQIHIKSFYFHLMPDSKILANRFPISLRPRSNKSEMKPDAAPYSWGEAQLLFLSTNPSRTCKIQ